MLRKAFNRLLHSIAFVVPFGNSFRPFLHRLTGCKIGKNVWIGKFVYIDDNHPECIEIGDNSTIGLRTSIFAHTYFGPPKKNNPDKVIIGKNVYIGPHCLILPNVKIGDNSVIKGGTVVTRNVPPNTLYGYQNPEALAVVTVPLTPEHGYEEFLKGLRPIRKNKNQKDKE
ncbi:MAG: acyltransferase [Ignavibacterium sp.]|nr:acyltransferase [Ignavibacterium sp.]